MTLCFDWLRLKMQTKTFCSLSCFSFSKLDSYLVSLKKKFNNLTYYFKDETLLSNIYINFCDCYFLNLISQNVLIYLSLKVDVARN